MVLCTQNPVDLDYKGLSNCGTWFIGRLQTARDKLRVMEGLAAASNGDIHSKEIDKLMSEMSSRVFIMRSIYKKEPILLQTRWAFSYLRGPLTLAQIEILTKNNKKDFVNIQAINKNKEGMKPVISLGIPQYFLRSSRISSPIYYRPFIAGFSKLHFIDKKYNVDCWLNSCLVVEVGKGKPMDWEIAESHSDLKQELTHSPAENASYREVPPEILNEKKYLGFQQDLSAYLYQNNTLNLFEFKELKLVSTTQESETDFRQKVSRALRESHDELVQKLRERYEKKIIALKDEVRKAEEKKNTQQQQSLYQKFEAFLSFLTTIIGAFFGRKFTKTTINQAGTTFRRMGRIGKESQDVTNAEENLQALQQQLQELQSQLEDEIAKIPSNTDVDNLKIDEVTIRPRKTDITIDEIALIWWP